MRNELLTSHNLMQWLPTAHEIEDACNLKWLQYEELSAKLASLKLLIPDLYIRKCNGCTKLLESMKRHNICCIHETNHGDRKCKIARMCHELDYNIVCKVIAHWDDIQNMRQTRPSIDGGNDGRSMAELNTQIDEIVLLYARPKMTTNKTREDKIIPNETVQLSRAYFAVWREYEHALSTRTNATAKCKELKEAISIAWKPLLYKISPWVIQVFNSHSNEYYRVTRRLLPREQVTPHATENIETKNALCICGNATSIDASYPTIGVVSLFKPLRPPFTLIYGQKKRHVLRCILVETHPTKRIKMLEEFVSIDSNTTTHGNNALSHSLELLELPKLLIDAYPFDLPHQWSLWLDAMSSSSRYANNVSKCDNDMQLSFKLRRAIQAKNKKQTMRLVKYALLRTIQSDHFAGQSPKQLFSDTPEWTINQPGTATIDYWFLRCVHYRNIKGKTLVCDTYEDGIEPNSPSLSIDDVPLDFHELATLHKFSLNDNTIEVLVDASTLGRQQSQWMCNHSTQLERTCKYCHTFYEHAMLFKQDSWVCRYCYSLKRWKFVKSKDNNNISSNKVSANKVSSTTTYSDNISSSSNKQFELSASLKVTAGVCDNCGYICTIQNSVGFHWDHINPLTKLSNIYTLCAARAPCEIIRAECSKCRLVCANCHCQHTRRQHEMGILKDIHKLR